MALLCLQFTYTQTKWQKTSYENIEKEIGKGTKEQLPSQYSLFKFNFSDFKKRLIAAPEENFTSKNASPVIVSIPFEDGHFESFRMNRVFYMHPELSAKYPEIQSYSGISTENPLHKIHISLSADNLYAVINGEKTVYLDPYKRGVSDYMTGIQQKKLSTKLLMMILVVQYIDEESTEEAVQFGNTTTQRNIIDGKFRTYDIAIACTSDYSAYHGNTSCWRFSSNEYHNYESK